MPAELPLVLSAVALAASALLFSAAGRNGLARFLGAVLVASGVAAPLVLGPLVEPSRAAGRALWHWSAVGGPTIEAAYRLDALTAVALALVVAYAGAALATAARAERRHVALNALVLAVGLVSIGLVVTDDLVAAIVVLATLAAVTVLALFAVAPVGATARAAAYLAIGLQAWILAALLFSRSGSATFLLSSVPPTAVTGAAILAGTGGALLFAGLYPVVAWSIDERDVPSDVGPLGSLVLMPAGIGATLLLVRLLDAGGVASPSVPLPAPDAEGRLAAVVLVLLAVALSLTLGRAVPARAIAVGAGTIVLVLALPFLEWAHVVLLAAILTTVYASVVSLALPDHWETVRNDLALVALWIAIATGSPLGTAGALVALLARAAGALASAVVIVPDRNYVAFVGGSAAFVAGAIVVGMGAAAAGDAVVATLGVGAAALLVVLELAQVARRYRVAAVPLGLDATSAIGALGLALLAAAAVVPLDDAVRPLTPAGPRLPTLQLPIVAVAAAVAVVIARVARPLLPRIEGAAARSERAMRVLDPAPVAVGVFRAAELATTSASAVFALFERRAGVWLAAAIIVGLLAWVVR